MGDGTGAANECTACTAVTGDLTAATHTCTSATDSRTSACAAATTTKKTVGADGAMDTCTAACGANTWDNSDVCTALTTCGTQLAVGSATAVARLKGTAVAADGTATANNVCDACTAGTFAATEADNCVACTVDANAATGTTYTCSAGDNARFSACKDTFYKDISGKSDVCRAHDTCGIAVVGATALRATTTAGTATANTVCAACAAGTYATGNGACGDCGTVTGALTASGTGVTPVVAAATYTCTSNADIRVSACAADKVKHAGVDASASDGVTATPDTCADSVGCGNDIAGTARTATTDKTATADAICPACVTGASETAGNCGCDAVTFKKSDSTACTTCTAAAAPDANSMYTCADATAATAFTCKAGFFKDGDKCTACTAIANAGPVVCSSATTSVGLCNTGFEMMSKTTFSTPPKIVCTACDAITDAAVTCTYPGNSQIATCNANFELKSGACTAV